MALRKLRSKIIKFVHTQNRSVTGVLQINIFWFKKVNLRPAYSGVIGVKDYAKG